MPERKHLYDAALPIYREIRDRLGEANCLQSQGLVMLIEGNTGEAFRRFAEVLKRHGDIQNAAGQQAALGHPALTARKAGASDQAQLLAAASLTLGRQINDRFGQSITLQLQLQVWKSQNNKKPALVLLSHLFTEISAPSAPEYAAQLEEKKKQLTEKAFREIEKNAEAIHAAAIDEARERFEKKGGDLFTLAS